MASKGGKRGDVKRVRRRKPAFDLWKIVGVVEKQELAAVASLARSLACRLSILLSASFNCTLIASTGCFHDPINSHEIKDLKDL
jgi:hypothetical protein